MRRSAMIAGNPWTLFLYLEAEPDSLSCTVRFQEINLDGDVADMWEIRYDRVTDALHELEMSYGIGAADWTDLD